MHGLQNNNDWTFLIGQELSRVCISPYEVTLEFHVDVEITIACDFEHLPHASNEFQLNLPKRAASLISLLHSHIVGVTIENNKTLVLTFSNQEMLKIHTNDESRRSFDVWVYGKTTIVV